jgi:threonine synthase
LKNGGEEIQVFIPTGAAGNLTSAIFAHQMGLPIQIHVATNQNDCVDVLLSKGILEMDKDVVLSAANAMDVGHPYNVERILYVFSDAATVKGLMEKRGKVQIPRNVMAKMRDVVKESISVSDAKIYDTVKSCWKNNNYLVRF